MGKRLLYRKRDTLKSLAYGWVTFLMIVIVTGGLTAWIAGADRTVIESGLRGLSQSLGGEQLDNVGTFWKILVNNERVILTTMLLGLIPIPFLFRLAFLTTSASVGFVIGFSATRLGLAKASLLFLTGIMPHGILEMSAIIIAVTLAKYVNQAIRGAIIRFFRQPHYTRGDLDGRAVVAQVLVIVVPMILIAAAVEAFVTPMLTQLFL